MDVAPYSPGWKPGAIGYRRLRRLYGDTASGYIERKTIVLRFDWKKATDQRDLLVASNQELTHEWWETRRHRFDLCVSAVVLAEAARGDQIYAAARLAVVRELTLVEVSDAAMALSRVLVRGAGLPAGAHEDALHIAVSATTGMDYLLTWNCKHIANGMIIPRVNAVVRSFGFEPPLIYTPQQLMEG